MFDSWCSGRGRIGRKHKTESNAENCMPLFTMEMIELSYGVYGVIWRGKFCRSFWKITWTSVQKLNFWLTFPIEPRSQLYGVSCAAYFFDSTTKSCFKLHSACIRTRRISCKMGLKRIFFDRIECNQSSLYKQTGNFQDFRKVLIRRRNTARCCI